jgi:ribosomal protein S18 acetylase RimI-like enzyme
MNAGVNIRKAALEDARGIARVHVRTWQSAYRDLLDESFLQSLSEESRAQGWQDTLAREGTSEFTLVAEESAQIVGFVSGGPEWSGDPLFRGQVYAIYILPTHQRQGIGRDLIRAAARELLIQNLTSMLIWVLVGNPASEFYEILGGRFVREQLMQIGSQTLTEIAYGWTDIAPLAR